MRQRTMIFSCLFCLQAPALAGEGYTKGTALDCTGVHLAEMDPDNLTKQERIALLEQSLVESVDRYSSCMEKVQAEMAASGGDSGGGTEQGTGAGGAASAQEGADDQTARQASQPSTKPSKPVTQPEAAFPTGRGAPDTPVPPKDNDAIVCTLLWDEIASEGDAQIKRDLIAQYEDYNCGN